MTEAPSAPSPGADLRRWARRAPDAPALVGDRGALTYGELHAAVRAAAARFRAAGVAPRQIATLRLGPGVEAVVRLFGLWSAGAVPAPLDERLSDRELAQAEALLGPAWRLDDDGLRAAAATGPARARSAAEVPADVVAFLTTSGSTGRPKAVGLGRAALVASADAVSERLALARDDRWGLALSLAHVGGLALAFRAIRNGSSVRIWPRFDADAVARDLLAGAVTHLSVVPVMLKRILECRTFAQGLRRGRSPTALRCVLVGGDAADGALLERARDAGVPVAATWGMTETASQIATAPPAELLLRPGAVGRALAGVRVRRGADGVLQAKGPVLASAIVESDGRSDAGPPPARPLPTDAEGWFSTRDVGRVDDEGRVRVEGRVDDVVVSGGLNVSAREVERVIRSHPGVEDAVVFGVPDPDWGEVVAAVVESVDPGVTPDAVDRHCRARLARGRCPSRIVVTDAIGRTWSGKVVRRASAHGLESATAAGGGPARLAVRGAGP